MPKMNMACTEGDILKQDVLDKIEDYLLAEQALHTATKIDRQVSKKRAEAARSALAEARRRYWYHLQMHSCDTAIMSVEAGAHGAKAV